MALNLSHLRVFRSVLEHNSLTAAARALRISQPAVSKQLADLEHALGVKLVERGTRGIRLTAAGELLGQHARRLFNEEEAAEAALRGLLGLELGQLSIGASTTIGNYMVPPLFGELNRAHPGLGLRLNIANTAAIQEQLLAGQLDLGLIEGRVTAKGLEAEVFAHDELVLIVAPAHPLTRKLGREISRRTIPELPFIMREPGSGTRDVIEQVFAEHGLEIEPVMSLGSTEAVKNAVAAGLGVSVVSRLTVELELTSGRLDILSLSDLRFARELRLLRLPGKHLSPAALEFLRLLRAR